MPHKIDLKYRIATAACLALSLLSALAWLAPAAAPTTASAQSDGSLFVRKISLRANDLVYSPSTNMLYASVPSRAGAGGNSITSVNPLTGDVGTPVFVGSEPKRLALSDDGNTLYTFLAGAYSIRRFDLQKQTPGLQFPVGRDFFDQPYEVNDLAVAPGAPGVVAVVRYYRGLSPAQAGVAIFDNGVQRQRTGPGHLSGSDYVAYSASASKLYGGASRDILRTLAIDATGVAGTTSTGAPVGARIKLAGGLVYGSAGQVMNPDTGARLGTFPEAVSDGSRNDGTIAFVPDVAAGRVYYLYSNFGAHHTLKAYDINTFLPVGSQSIPGVSGTPTELVRWGANGLAFCTSNGEVYVLQTSLIPSGSPIPTPTTTPEVPPTPGPAAASVRQIPLVANSIAYNAARQEFYATLPSTAPSGNSVARVNTATGAVESTVFVGSEPNRMALSDDGQTMYVNLMGDSAVRRVDLRTQTPGLQFSIGAGGSSHIPNNLAVMPGAADTVAVSRSDGDLAIYDNGVKRPQGAPGGGALHFGPGAGRLYSGGFTVQKLAVHPAGLSKSGQVTAAKGGPTTYFDKARGLLFTSGGDVIDPEAGNIVGTFSGLGLESQMAVDSAAGRAYFLTNDIFGGGGRTLFAYDIDTYLPVGFVNLSFVPGTQADLVRWGDNGLAFRTKPSCCTFEGDTLVLVETDLVGAPRPARAGVGLAPGGATAQESDAALVFNVTRTGDTSGPATVSYTTSDYTAAAGSDYTAASGTLTFPPGEVNGSFQVAVRQDNVYEGGEAFMVTLSNPTGGALLNGPASAFVTINDDELPPTVSVGDVRVLEGNAGTSDAQFRVSLSHPSAVTVSVNYATGDGTASSPGDFAAASGTLIFPPLTTSKLFTVKVNGDLQVEPEETFTVTLSSPINSSLGRARAAGTIANDDGLGHFQFSAPSYVIAENGGSALIIVRRLDAPSAPASVGYTTADGTATETSDYNLTLGTLSFAAGETEKSFAVLLTDDALVEPDETFTITLDVLSGGAAGTPVTTTVTLFSDDIAPRPNPVGDGFDAAFFVRQHYQDFLNRAPDPEGLGFWTGDLMKCGADAACAEVRRVNVSAAFFLSIEFQETGFFVYRLHQAAYNTQEALRWRTFLADAQETGRGVQVGVGDWRAQLESNKKALAERFVTTPAFVSAYHALSNSQYVEALAAHTFDPLAPGSGGALTQAERDQLVADLDQSKKTRAEVLRAVAENAEFSRRQTNKAFVLMQYFGYLRRNPNSGPDSDFSGYNFWLGKLNEFNGDFIRAEMVKAFIQSIEYRRRFGQ